MAVERRPTMRDVAARADVSFKTVSRVVNEEGGVREELIVRVEAAVEELGYRPDHRARGLRRSDPKAVTIGFVPVDVSNPFFSSVFRSIEEVARARECLVLAGSTEGSSEREQQLIETFAGRRVDGLIVVPSGTDTTAIELELRQGTPVVFLDLEPNLPSFDLVRSDHFQGTKVLAEHLLDHGHTDVAYLGDDPSIFSGGLRLDGFMAAMVERGIDVPASRVVTGTHSEHEWREIATKYLRSTPRPTAVVSAQNLITIGTTRALHDLNLHHVVAQVGFDDVELADIVDPGITVVMQQPRHIGRLAAEMVFSRLDGNVGDPVTKIIPVPLITRGSGEIPPPITTS